MGVALVVAIAVLLNFVFGIECVEVGDEVETEPTSMLASDLAMALIALNGVEGGFFFVRACVGSSRWQN